MLFLTPVCIDHSVESSRMRHEREIRKQQRRDWGDFEAKVNSECWHFSILSRHIKNNVASQTNWQFDLPEPGTLLHA